jgi:hypothetical protein
MIRLVGLNKIFLILLLGALAGLFAIYYYVVSTPDIEQAKRELSNNNSEIERLSEELEELKSGIAQFNEQEAKFKELFQHDIFNSQNRVDARRILTFIRDASGVTTAQYTVKSAQVEKNKKMEEADYQILNTPMEFSLEAVQDSDIYKFMFLLNHGFPGQVNFETVVITREEQVTFPLLKQIGIGQEELRPLVRAKITANWKTMVPDTKVEVTGGEE